MAKYMVDALVKTSGIGFKLDIHFTSSQWFIEAKIGNISFRIKENMGHACAFL